MSIPYCCVCGLGACDAERAGKFFVLYRTNALDATPAIFTCGRCGGRPADSIVESLTGDLRDARPKYHHSRRAA